MEFKEPFKVYTAYNNIQAHLVVNILGANGIEALVEEDQSVVSLWAFGVISQFHQPNVWVEKADSYQAAQLIRNFEEEQRKLQEVEASTANVQIDAECEECGKTSTYPKTLDGTTQECGHCHAYLDVGELDWDEDIGEPDE